MHFTTDQIIQIVITLMPVIIAVIGMIFHLNQKDREELAHAALCGAPHKALYVKSMIMLSKERNAL